MLACQQHLLRCRDSYTQATLLAGVKVQGLLCSLQTAFLTDNTKRCLDIMLTVVRPAVIWPPCVCTCAYVCVRVHVHAHVNTFLAEPL